VSEREGARQSDLPLAGVTVVEVAAYVFVPMAGAILADLGADVIKVEPRRGDPLRGTKNASTSAQTLTDQPAPNVIVELANRGKRSIVVDLKHPRGAGVVLDLAARANVLLEGLRPGVTERLGIGPGDCWARNPGLVYGRMTGWGQDGPLAQSAGHDIGYIAITGALHAIGRAGGPPQPPVNYLGDFGGGSMFLVLGVVAALWEARESGRGQVVDAAIVDGTATLATMTYSMLAGGVWRDERGVNLLDTGAPFYDVYATADGRHMAVGALEPQFYAAFTEILFAPEGLPGDLPAQHDRPRWPELRSRFAARFAERSQEEWTKSFSATDACVAPVRTMTEAPADPHLAARGSYVTLDGVVQPAPAPRFGDGTAGAPVAALPPGPVTRPGTHTREVLTGLGFTDVDELLTDGAVWQAEH